MAHKIFTVQQKIRFQHTDMAGIVFFPRFAEMINATNEDLWTSFGFPFQDILHKNGLPAVHISMDFIKPGFCGDIITKHLEITHIGTTSYTMHHWFTCDGECILDATQKCVFVAQQQNGRMKPVEIPDTIRHMMHTYLKQTKN